MTKTRLNLKKEFKNIDLKKLDLAIGSFMNINPSDEFINKYTIEDSETSFRRVELTERTQEFVEEFKKLYSSLNTETILNMVLETTKDNPILKVKKEKKAR
tara:strand:+ start:10166 stop:10468 length:303 start_codon:yes stop_codon:yes gene_type:complete